jgi:hypothetical protein
MRIVLERTGGFAAIKKNATVDSASLTPQDAAELQSLIDASGVLNAPAPAAPSQAADQFQYNVTIDDRSIVLHDPTSPEIRRLLDWVWAHKQ